MRRGKATWRALIAEFLGTAILTFVGVAIIVYASLVGHPAGIAMHAIAPALVVMALIYTLGEASGAHFNPAVTLAFATRGDFPWRSVPAYVVAQILGSLGATALVLAVLGAPPAAIHEPLFGSYATRFGIESILSAMLVLVILATANRAQIVGHNAAIAVAGAITFDGLVGMPISGASMNPARSFGPIVLTGSWDQAAIYFIAPVAGALVAVGLMRLVYGPPTHTEKEKATGN